MLRQIGRDKPEIPLGHSARLEYTPGCLQLRPAGFLLLRITVKNRFITSYLTVR